MINKRPFPSQPCHALWRRTLLSMILCLLAGSAWAADVEWKKKTFSYVAEQKKLPEFLRDFAASQGLSIFVSPEVDGIVNAKFDLQPANILDVISATFGLIWYYDGNILYVYSASAAKSELIRISDTNIDRLMNSVRSLNIYDPRFPPKIDRIENTIYISGPPRYVDLVLEMAKVIDQNAGRRGTAVLKLFPLKYAWAADFTANHSGEKKVFPGVASTLRDMFEVKSSPQPKVDLKGAGGMSSHLSAASLSKLRGATGGAMEMAGAKSTTEAMGAADPATDFFDGALPRFKADGRMNAVLVRDIPERIAQYEALIKQLDVKPGMVEIEANIVEVSTNFLENIGVDWRIAQPGRFDLQTGNGLNPQVRIDASVEAAQAGAAAITDLATPKGAIITAIGGNLRHFIIARINALAESGDAKVIAKPKILTLDNVEAQLDNTNTFHVRVAGNLEVGLFTVQSGTSLRVTPLIVEEGDTRRIKLAVHIEDGSTIAQQVDQIPGVRKSTIGTQAFINEGESLLIAGYALEQEQVQESGVPLLSKLPGVGGLFKTSGKSRNRTERLFIITPKVVGP